MQCTLLWGSQGSAGLVSFAGAGVGDVNVEVEDPQGRGLAEVAVETKATKSTVAPTNLFKLVLTLSK